MALHKAVKGKDHAHKPPVVPLPGKGVCQGGGPARLKRLGHYLLQSLGGKLLLPLVREDFELWGDAQQVKKLPGHFRAKAIHGANMGLVQAHALPAQKLVARVLSKELVELELQPGPHFSGGGLGKGDN